MGYRKAIDYQAVRLQILGAAYQVSDHRVDGFNQWCTKQELLRIEWLLKGVLARLPKFPDEGEFIKALEAQQIVDTLKED